MTLWRLCLRFYRTERLTIKRTVTGECDRMNLVEKYSVVRASKYFCENVRKLVLQNQKKSYRQNV